MVELTGELGEPPERIVDLWRLDELRGHRHRRRRDQPRRADDLHGDPPVGALPRASPRAGRGGRDDRRGPDPEPRDDRRQRRQRLAGGRHAAGPARRGRHVRARLGPRRADRRRAAEFWPAYRRTALAPDELLLRIRDPAPRRPRDALPQGRDAARPVDQQGRDGARLARRSAGAARPAVDRRPPGARVRGGHPDPRHRDRGRPRGPPADPGDRRPRRRDAGRRARTRSTTSARPPSTGGSSRRASCIGSSARRAAGDDRRTGRQPRHRRRSMSSPRARSPRPSRRCSRARAGSSGAWPLARPFGSVEAMFDRAREIAHAMPLDEQLELIDAHPRLGAPPATVSDAVARRAGLRPGAGGPGDAAAASRTSSSGSTRPTRRASGSATASSSPAGRARRCCPGSAAALEADRDAEIERALDAVVDIAQRPLCDPDAA